MDRFGNPRFQALCFALAACAVGNYILGNQSGSAERVAEPQEMPSFALHPSPTPAQPYQFSAAPASGLLTGH